MMMMIKCVLCHQTWHSFVTPLYKHIHTDLFLTRGEWCVLSFITKIYVSLFRLDDYAFSTYCNTLSNGSQFYSARTLYFNYILYEMFGISPGNGTPRSICLFLCLDAITWSVGTTTRKFRPLDTNVPTVKDCGRLWPFRFAFYFELDVKYPEQNNTVAWRFSSS